MIIPMVGRLGYHLAKATGMIYGLLTLHNSYEIQRSALGYRDFLKQNALALLGHPTHLFTLKSQL